MISYTIPYINYFIDKVRNGNSPKPCPTRLCFNHLLVTVETGNIDYLSCPTTAPTDRTYILSVMCRNFADWLYTITVTCMRSYANRYQRGIGSAHFNFSQFIVIENELKECVSRLGVAITVFFGTCHDKSVSICFSLESFIMIYTFVARVLFVENGITKHMYHFSVLPLILLYHIDFREQVRYNYHTHFLYWLWVEVSYIITLVGRICKGLFLCNGEMAGSGLAWEGATSFLHILSISTELRLHNSDRTIFINLCVI